MKRSQQTGKFAERRAAHFLESHGLSIIASNYTCRRGEIDIIALDGTTMIFVEVKFRSRSNWGAPADQVTFKKKQRLVSAAREYLSQPLTPPYQQIRFDVIACQRTICWIQRAFTLDDLIID